MFYKNTNTNKFSEKSPIIFWNSRKNPYGLIVTPPELNASNKLLKTSLFVDDGDVIDYESNSSIFEFTFDFTVRFDFNIFFSVWAFLDVLKSF